MTPPRVAILLPVRNGASTLLAALESLAAQTFGEFECLIVDDGSTDESAQIAEAFAARDSRMRCLRQPPSGLVVALEHGRASTQAPYLARQDADDVSLPDRFERQVRHLDGHPEVGLVATRVEIVTWGGETDGARRYARWLDGCVTAGQIACGLWVESPLPHPTVMVRREILAAAGGYRDRGWPEDYDLWLRLLRRGVKMEKLPCVGLRWFDHPGRASRTQPAYHRDRFLACRAHHLARVLDGRAVILWGAGRDGRHAGRALLQNGVSIEAYWDIDPRKIGRTRQGRPILDAEEGLQSLARSSDASARGESAPGGTPGSGEVAALWAPVHALTRERPVVLATVGSAGARELIQARLHGAGFHEGRDFLCLA